MSQSFHSIVSLKPVHPTSVSSLKKNMSPSSIQYDPHLLSLSHVVLKSNITESFPLLVGFNQLCILSRSPSGSGSKSLPVRSRPFTGTGFSPMLGAFGVTRLVKKGLVWCCLGLVGWGNRSCQEMKKKLQTNRGVRRWKKLTLVRVLALNHHSGNKYCTNPLLHVIIYILHSIVVVLFMMINPGSFNDSLTYTV